MSVPGTGFIIGLMVLASVIFFLPRGRPRQILLAIANALFLILSIPNWQSGIVLAAFVLSGFAMGDIVRRTENLTFRSRLLTAYIILLLIAFVVVKQYQFLDLLIPAGSISRIVVLIGISYMLFRQIHYVVDVSQDQIETTSLWTYLNYQLNLFGLYAGPIQRYQQFDESWSSLAPVVVNPHDRLKAIARLMIGILKVQIIGAKALDIYQFEFQHQMYARSAMGIYHFTRMFYAYPAYIYFNFSGYCDVVIAGASLVGIRLPENFDRPWLARNPIDYWTRWHMSLTNWIRDYIFTPLYKKGIENNWMQPQRMGYLCFFIALFLAGVWHGSTWNFVVFGLLHGLGVSATKMWEEHLIRTRGRPGLKKYLKSKPIRVFATLGTFHFVCFVLVFFPSDMNHTVHFIWTFAKGKS